MLKIIRNEGQCKALEGKCKYVFHIQVKDVGDMYAKPGLKPIVGYILAKFKFGFR